MDWGRLLTQKNWLIINLVKQKSQFNYIIFSKTQKKLLKIYNLVCSKIIKMKEGITLKYILHKKTEFLPFKKVSKRNSKGKSKMIQKSEKKE